MSQQPGDSLVACVVAAKDKLPRVRRDLFDLMYQRGQTLEQAAQRLGVSVGTAAAEHASMLRSLRCSLPSR